MSCKSEQPSNTVKITVQAIGSKGQVVAIKSTNMLSVESITLKETKLDSLGLAKLEFDLPNTQFVQIQVGEKTNPLLLSPSDDLDITLDLKDTDSKPIFKGKAAEASNYLNQSNLINQKFERSGGKFIFELDPAGYAKRSDSLSTAYLTLHKAFLDTTKIDKSVCSLLENRNRMYVLFQKQNYVLATFNEVKDSIEIPLFFRHTNHEIPSDTNFLKSQMGEYALVLQLMTITQNIEQYKGKTPKQIEELEGSFPLENDKKISNSNYVQPIKEFLLAKNINYWVATLGVKPSVRQIYKNFMANCTTKTYLADVNENYNKYDSLSAGRKAPIFTGTTPNGKKVSLADFKGKIVFIDVWATWCGPCKEQLPKTRIIENKYKGNNQVAFVYVSVDNNIEDWKKLLKKEKDFNGIQIHDPFDNKHQSIWEKYLVWGIPRYILIDQEGKIINSNAPRPSSGKVEALIDQYLVKTKPNS